MNHATPLPLGFAATPSPNASRVAASAFTAFVLACALAGHAPALAVERAGTIKAVTGEVIVVRGTERQVGQSGDALSEADRLETGPTGGASMVLRDGTVVTMGGNASLTLTRTRYDATTQIGEMLFGLLRGSMRVVTGLIAKVNPRSVEIHTPTATLGVRGTDFIVEAGAE